MERILEFSVITDSEADTESVDFPESVRHQNLGFCGRMVLGHLFNIYLSGRRHLSYWRTSLLGRVGVGSGTMVIGVVGSGQWAAPHCRPVIGKRSAQCAWCMLRNKCSRH